MAVILGERKENVPCSDDSGTLLVACMYLTDKCCCEVAHIFIHSITQWKCIKEVHRHPLLDSSLSCGGRMRSTISCTCGINILCDLKSIKYWKQQTSLLSLSLSKKESIRWLIKAVFFIISVGFVPLEEILVFLLQCKFN